MLRLRWIVIAIYAVLVPLAVWAILGIPNDSGLDRLVVPGDPDLATTRAFQQIFPEPQMVVLVFEAPDPWAPAAVARVDAAAQQLRDQKLGAFSALDALRRARPAATLAELKQLATSAPLFRQQGLVGDGFLSVIVQFTDRDVALPAIDAIAGARKVGAPLVNAWLERASRVATARSFAIFGVLLLAVTWGLYRSLRALLAIALALGAAVALGVAAGALLGFSFTIVSALVPLTIMVTSLATLTYLHSRYVDQPDDSLESHVAALRNKLLPVTASTIAAASGFAALAVSHVRPIRDMGVWTAIGLAIGWVVALTLFPALQRVLRAPIQRRVAVRGAVFERMARALPGFTYRWRWALVGGALALCAAGGLGLSRAGVEDDALANIDRDAEVYQDMAWFRAHVMELNLARVWIHLPTASATEPATLRALDGFQRALEALPMVTGVTGPTTPLRMRSYLAGNGDALASDAAEQLEEMLLSTPDLRGFIDVDKLQDVQIQVLFRGGHADDYARLEREVARLAIPGAKTSVVGEAMLQAKITTELVPTLAESFAITAGLIFLVFLVVFRSGTERILALLPSLVALLVTFLGMRLLGGSLNVATIIIATTVLGATENDQLHFFHHMHEKRGEPLEDQLAHAFRVSGRAVAFATLINAVGFLGLASSGFPPLRQFGIMTATAFVLALVADFVVLPASLWIARRARPRARMDG